MNELTICSPAKVNLYLEVLGPRADGYHEVETVLTTIGLCDEVRLEAADDISVVCPDGGAPEGEGNLAWQAAQLLRRESGGKRGAHVRIKKRIPEAAGLGGGSSNAACTLLGLNLLWGLGIGQDELARLAAGIGMDVPFFVRVSRAGNGREPVVVRGAAVATGRGEEVEPIGEPPGGWFTLVMPWFGIRAARAYRGLRFGLTPRRADLRMVAEALESGDLQQLAAHLFNRLEEVTLDAYPELACLKVQLHEAGAIGALVSGSGPVVFGLTSCREDACRIASGVLPDQVCPSGESLRSEAACMP